MCTLSLFFNFILNYFLFLISTPTKENYFLFIPYNLLCGINREAIVFPEFGRPVITIAFLK